LQDKKSLDYLECEMTRNIINITLLEVIVELESFLATYPAQLHQQFSNDSDLREKLINYVLTRVPNHYVVRDTRSELIYSKSFSCSTLEQIEIKELIQQGAYYLLKEQTKLNSSCQKHDASLTYSSTSYHGIPANQKCTSHSTDEKSMPTCSL
jgi:hypothetical protein